MSTAAKILAPFLAAVAVSLQGCFLADYPWAVKIYIAEQCSKRVKELRESDDAMKDLHLEECAKMDEDKMEEFGITTKECKRALKEQVRFFLGVECKAQVAERVSEKCGGAPFDDDASPTPAPEEERRLDPYHDHGDAPAFDADECKAAIESAVEGFQPEAVSEAISDLGEEAEEMAEDEEELEEGGEGVEAFVALVRECCSAVQTAVEDNSGKEFYKGVCANVTEKKNMDALGVKDKDCSKYMGNLYGDVGVFACVEEIMSSEDMPEVEDVTLKDIKSAVSDFMEGMDFPNIEELQGYVIEKIMEMGTMDEEDARLRLYQKMRRGRWVGRRSGLSAIAVAASCALALAALAAVAWRLGAGRKSSTEERQPMVAGAQEPAA